MNVCGWAHEDQRACGYLTPSFFALLLLGTVSHQQAPVILLSQQCWLYRLTQSHTQWFGYFVSKTWMLALLPTLTYWASPEHYIFTHILFQFKLV